MRITCRMSKSLCPIVVAVIGCLAASVLQAAEPAPEYLSDSLFGTMTSTQAWGQLGQNTAVKSPDRAGVKLRIKDQEYQRGLGHHANGEIRVPLEGLYKTFECEVGLQWQEGQSHGSVVFQVFVDDRQVFESGVMRMTDPARKVSVSVEDADALCLVVTDAGDGLMCDCADWAEARLLADPAAPGRIAQAAVDIAPFASVARSDPNRMSGTAAERVQEFPAADVFLETGWKPAANGSYVVTANPDGPSAIGLRWYEMRVLRRLELHWADATAIPSPDGVQLQYWVGASPWQGEWKPLKASLDTSPGVWSWQIARGDQPSGTYRVRWVLPASSKPMTLKKISAFSRSSWMTADLRAELRQPMSQKQVAVVVTNGKIVVADGKEVAPTCSWDVSSPLELKIRYSKPRPDKSDRTLLRFELAGQPISVAVEDVVAHGCVFVPSAGLFVTLNPPQTTLAQYLEQIAGKRTVLEEVRSLPDQTLAQAMAKTHNPIQENGPMLVSLACDNRKFITYRDGTISFFPAEGFDSAYPDLYALAAVPHVRDCQQISPRFGSGKNEQIRRRLDGDWLPAPITSVEEDGIVYSQRTYVAPVEARPPADSPAWVRDRAVCVAEYTIENSQSAPADVSLNLTLYRNVKNDQRADLTPVKEGFLAVNGDRVFAAVETGEAAPLHVTADSGTIRVSGNLATGGKARLFIYLPAWKLAPADYAVLSGGTKWADAMKSYWSDMLRPAMQVETPTPLLTNVIRASQVHCLLAARNEDRGRYVSPWIGSDRYGPLESESQAVIRGMDMCGQTEFARRSLDFFIKRYNDQGFLTTGYTLVGNGEILWTLAEHFARCGDREWFKTVAPELARACKWIIAQRDKTKALDVDGEKVPEYGLAPPGVTADWARYAYRFFNDAQYCHGLEKIAQELAAIGHPDAPAIQDDARRYREDLLRAYRWTQARCPVVALRNGAWVPNHPAMLDVFGNIEEMVPAEDGNRSWCYSVEIGTHHLAATGLLDPNSPEVTNIMNYLEDHQFLRTGLGDYPEEETRKDVFNLGGFSKVQPYYTRNAEISAMRDDVKPFLRSYFNALSTLLNLENLSFWEHFHNTGGWNKTHETAWFLCQTALMFAMERGNELWLAPMVTDRWLEDGKKIEVGNLPTRFGSVSYSIRSSSASGHIDAVIDPPTRETPERLVLRIRHPEGKPMRAVTVNGKPHQDFDPGKECVILPPGKERLAVQIDY